VRTGRAVDPDPSLFVSVADPYPGSWMGKISESGIRIRDEQPGSYFQELRNHFFW
jgi:hypothetical protein